MRATKTIFLSALATLCLAGSANAAPTKEQQVADIFRNYDNSSSPGCAVGVFDHGKALLSTGFGAADIATGRKIDAHTLFYAASMSKQFTALSIARLVDEGKLRITDDIRRWLPEMPDYGTTITIDMLLHHTGGFRDYIALFALAGLSYNTVSNEELLAMIVRQKGLLFTPGTKFNYSNAGYFLLGQIVGRASGETLQTYARRHILTPLGMNESYFRDGPNPPGAKVAQGYIRKADGSFEAQNAYPFVSGAGGFMTSVADLQKYDRDFQIDGKVWTPAARRILLKPGTLTNGEVIHWSLFDLDYAGGVMVGERRGQRWVEHGGTHAAFRSQYARMPDLKFGVAMLCNRADELVDPYLQRVVDVYKGDVLTGAWAPQTEPAQAPFLDADLLDALAGRYRSDELGADLILERVGGDLQAKVLADGTTTPASAPIREFRRGSDGRIRISRGELSLDRAADGKVKGFTFLGDTMTGLRFVRVP